MSAGTGTYAWLNRALDGTPVWDMGQLGKLDRRVLDQAARAGKLKKARVRWMFIANAPKRAVWYRPDLPPQEVMAEEYRAGKVAPAGN